MSSVKAVPNKPAEKAAEKPAEKSKKEPRTAEQKAAKFKELATKRGSKVIAALHGIGNLASANYVYTPEQVTKLFAAVDGAVSDAKARFAAPATKGKPSFSLD